MNEGNVNGWAEIGGRRYDGIIAAAAVLRALLAGIIAIAAVAVAAEATSPATPDIWADPENGCEYLRLSGGITPRLNSTGLQQGCDWINPDGPLPPDEIIAASEAALPSSTADTGEEAKQQEGRCVRWLR